MNNMVTEWSEISTNTIEALKIMGMGMLAIFIVIAIITLVVYILNVTDKKIQAKKNAPKAVATDSPQPISTNAPTAIATQKSEATPMVEEKTSINMSELGEAKYRKGKDEPKQNRYRKRDEDAE